jgi:hypothetical protein
MTQVDDVQRLRAYVDAQLLAEWAKYPGGCPGAIGADA